MENRFGDWVTEIEDDKEIAKLVWEDDKYDIIDYAEKVYTEQGYFEKIDRNITFEEIWNLIDHDIFKEADEENWNYFEKKYISDWKYEHNLED